MSRPRNVVIALLLLVLIIPGTMFAIGAQDVATTDINKLVTVKELKSAKGATRVAIPGYRVIFTTRSKHTAKAEDWLGGVGGGRSSSGAKATMEVVLGNIDFETFQKIADDSYADFVKRLEATGLEVVPAEAMRATASFQKIKLTPSNSEKPYTKKSRDGKTFFLVAAPSEVPLWFSNWDGDISDQGFNQNNSRAVSEMAKELDAVVLHPILHVDFATLGGSGGKFAKRATVNAKAAIYVNPSYTLFFIQNAKAGSFARINDGIGVEGDPGEFVTADQASNEAFIGGMQKIGIDFGPVKSKKNMVLQTNKDNFQNLATEALTGANEAFKRGIEAARK
ncbi:MAG TPA: hypothetical protein VF701_15360 [Thermoanaerobaculia bacterium]